MLSSSPSSLYNGMILWLKTHSCWFLGCEIKFHVITSFCFIKSQFIIPLPLLSLKHSSVFCLLLFFGVVVLLLMLFHFRFAFHVFATENYNDLPKLFSRSSSVVSSFSASSSLHICLAIIFIKELFGKEKLLVSIQTSVIRYDFGRNAKTLPRESTWK